MDSERERMKAELQRALDDARGEPGDKLSPEASEKCRELEEAIERLNQQG